MTTPILTLIFFAGWGLTLVVMIVCWRAVEVLTGKTVANDFASGSQHGGDLYWRLNRAHLNTLENLPIFGALIVAGHLCGLTDGAFAQLAVTVVVGRVGQTFFHVASNRVMAVNLRFTCYLIQVAAMGAMVVSLIRLPG